MKKSKEHYDFLSVKPPKPIKQKGSNVQVEIDKLLQELINLFSNSCIPKKSKVKKIYCSGKLSRKFNQRCVVKMTYGNSKEAHKNFLRSYMVQKNKDEVKEKPTYFDAVYDEVPEYEIDKYESEMTDLYFKFILSPESKNVPLKKMAREFMKNLQLQTGYSFSWKAVIHYNTGHPHVHILINGKDRKTRNLIKRIPPRIIRNAHLSAEQICTNLIGPVTSEELELRKNDLFFANRWTSLDENILKKTISKEYISNNGIEYSSFIIPTDLSLEKRLKSLVEIGLAISFKNENSKIFYLEKDWNKKLKSIGRYNSFLQARSNLLFSTVGILEQYTPEVGKIEGIVTQIYQMNDESIWCNAIVIENRGTKKAYFIPLKNPPDKNLIKKNVTVECKINQYGKLSPQVKVFDNSYKTIKKQKKCDISNKLSL